MSNKRNFTIEDALKQEKNERKAKKAKKRKLVVGIIAGILVIPIAITGLTHFFANRKKNQNTNTGKSKSSISTMNLSDMGNELIPEESKAINEVIYGATTGDIDKDKLVEKENKIYVDKESADKADKVGETTIDTKDDTLVVKPDGTVEEKNPGYEVKDETGKVVDSGEGEIPKGYAWDSVLEKYLPEEEVGKYVYADETYYDSEGNVALQEGDLVSKETLANAKKYLTTTKPQIQTQPTTIIEETNPSTSKEDTKPTTQPETQPETSNCIPEENINNGIYTDSYGNVWIDYEAYVNGMLDFDNVYTLEDGILRYDAHINEKVTQKVR